MSASAPSIKLATHIRRRREVRDGFWPDADSVTFPTHTGGWARVPRTIPVISTLIDELAPREKPARVYSGLWSYDFGDGFIELPDLARFAVEVGYMSRRAERTVAERLQILEDLGFLRSKPLASRKFGYLLLLDPHRVVAPMRSNPPSQVSSAWLEVWLSAYDARCREAKIHPAALEVPDVAG